MHSRLPAPAHFSGAEGFLLPLPKGGKPLESNPAWRIFPVRLLALKPGNNAGADAPGPGLPVQRFFYRMF
jgi:hypothetical protein